MTLFKNNPQLSQTQEKLLKKLLEADNQTTQKSFYQLEKETTVYPLSSAQKRLYFLHELTENSVAYNLPVAIEITGPLSLPRLENAFQMLILRHEPLRTSFKEVNGEPVQIIHEQAAFQIEFCTTQTDDIASLFSKFVTKFDLNMAPLLRVTVASFSTDHHFLFLDMHHIISDAKSFAILLEEIAILYQKKPLTPLPIQYKDYVVWQKEHLTSSAIQEQKNYWLKQLIDEIPILNLPIDSSREIIPQFEGNIVYFHFDEQLTHGLKTLAVQEKVTLYMLLMALYQILLFKYTHQNDLIVGSSTEGRSISELKRLVGVFINAIPIRTFPSTDKKFQIFLKEVKSTCLEALQNQEVPFEDLVEMLSIQRELNRNPLFETLFDLHQDRDLVYEFDNLQLKILSLSSGVSKFDLSLEGIDKGTHLQFHFEYCSSLFTKKRIEKMAKHFESLAYEILRNPQECIGNMNILSEVEKNHLLFDLNRSSLTPPSILPLFLEIFAQQVKNKPSSIAVSYENEQLTYAELDKQSTHLAYHILQLEVKKKQNIAFFMDRELVFIISMLAIFKAGAAYIPLDPNSPYDRIQSLLQESRCAFILTDRNFKIDKYPVFLVSKLLSSPIEAHSLPLIHPRDLAYIIFTSGSTGKPKGVMIEHQGMVNHLWAKVHDLNLTSLDIIAQTSSQTFDVSIWQFLVALLVGGKVTVFSNEKAWDPYLLLTSLEKEKVTIFETVPSHMNLVLEEIEKTTYPLSSLRWLILNGEALFTDLCRLWYKFYPQISILNAYGPTECSDDVCHYKVLHNLLPAEPSVPIGNILDNLEGYVLDNGLSLVPFGVTGELFIEGIGVGRGYLEAADKTADAFLPFPFDLPGKNGKRIYRTGDRVRYRSDGCLEYLGRCDHQVKLHGQRIELGEIESTLNQHDSILQSVIKVESTDNQKHLIAYIVLKKSNDLEQERITKIRHYMEVKLPFFMVPSFFVILPSLPLLTSGKVNRKSLILPSTFSISQNYCAPSTNTEKKLAFIWNEILKLSEVSVNDSFFRLGGHSLLATQLIARILRLFDIKLSLRTVFESPTIKELSLHIDQALLNKKESINEQLPEIIPDTANKYEEFPLTDIQQAYWLGRSGIFALGDVSVHVYNEYDCSGIDLQRLEKAWNHIIERHDALRLVITTQGTQKILEKTPYYKIETLDLRQEKAELIEEQLCALRQTHSHEVFPLATWPLFSLRAIKLRDKTRLYISFDALILDGWSVDIVFSEWVRLYDNMAIQLPPLELCFRDYVLATQSLKKTKTYSRDRKYWLNRLKDFPLAPQLPLLTSPESIQAQKFSRCYARLACSEWTKLQALLQDKALSPTGLLSAAFAEILHLYSGNNHFAINLTLFDRLFLHREVNDIAGDFTSLTLLEVDHRSSEHTFFMRTKKLQEQLWQDLDHSLFGGVEFIRELSRQYAHLENRTLFPVVFTSVIGLDNKQNDDLIRLFGKEVFSITQTPQVWLDFKAYEVDGDLVIEWDYVTELFEKDMIQDMHHTYYTLLQQLIIDKSLWHKMSIVALPARQKKQRDFYNFTNRDIAYQSIQSLFYQQVDTSPPNHNCILSSKRNLTYQDLSIRSSQLANYLQSLKIETDQLVAVILKKGAEQVIACLGIIHAGAAYLPIDPLFPKARITELLHLANPSYVITQDSILSNLSELAYLQSLHPKNIISLDPLLERLSTYPLKGLEITQNLNNLVYVIFTSGSTGKPKGVMIEQKSLINILVDLNERFSIQTNDRILALSNLHFDLSAYDIFGILLAGGTIVFPEPDRIKEPQHWIELILEHHITIWNTVPMFMQILIEFLKNSPQDILDRLSTTLRLIFLSGDWIPVDLPAKIKKIFLNAQIISLGGATEASIWSIAYEINPFESFQASIPYGYPLYNQTCHILNQKLEPCPEGVTGDLYIGGIGLARGYWQDQEKTDQSFLIHSELGRLYKTGDLGRFHKKGWIEFLGRSDFQLKIGGHRIEPGEIESLLNQHKDISQSLILAETETHQHKRLVAYIIPKKDDSTSFSPTISDSKERTSFTLQQHGKLSLHSSNHVISLENLYSEVEYFNRKSYRKFEQESLQEHKFLDWLQISFQQKNHKTSINKLPIHVGILSDLLSGFAALNISPLPKYRYPSAGSLYPVQTYLSIPSNCIETLDEGNYYHNPLNHELIKIPYLKELTRSSFFTIYFAEKLSAIEPLYGTLSHQFCVLEAGYMTKLLQNACDRNKLLYDEQNSFSSCPFQLASNQKFLSGIKIGIRSLNKSVSNRVGVFLYIKESGIQNVKAGWYAYDYLLNKLCFIASIPPFEVFASSVDTYSILQDAACALFFVREKKHPPSLIKDLLIQAGVYAQSLMDNGIKNQIGICPIGMLDSCGLRALKSILPHHEVLHTLFIGKITQEQIRTKNPSEMRKNVFEEILKKYLQNQLPAYMIPKTFFYLEKWPLTQNGKIDQKNLLTMISHSCDIQKNITLPRNKIEEKLLFIWKEIFPDQAIGIYDSIFELGGDSLLITRIALKVREVFHKDLPLRTFFETTTIAALAKILNPSASSPSFPHFCLEDTNLPSFIQPLIPLHRFKKPKALLLTGATGFLGAYILSDLIRLTNAKIYCLLRAENTTHALERLKENLNKYQLSSTYLEDRIIPVLGNLESSLLGCSKEEFDKLATEVDAIYHNGALVHHIYDYKMLKSINVSSTIELLKLATLRKDKAFFYISSLTAAVDRDLEGHLEEKFPERTPDDLFSGYQQTKWVSEKLLSEAQKRGISVTIFRPNTITGDEKTGACSFENDHFLRLVKGCLQIGYAPLWETLIDLLPVNFVSLAISKISLNKYATGKVFHITHPHISWIKLMQTLQRMGYPIHLISPYEWRTDYLPKIDSSNALFPLLSLYISAEDENFDPNRMIAKNQNSLKLLKKLNLTPPIINDKLLTIYFDYLKKKGFLT